MLVAARPAPTSWHLLLDCRLTYNLLAVAGQGRVLVLDPDRIKPARGRPTSTSTSAEVGGFGTNPKQNSALSGSFSSLSGRVRSARSVSPSRRARSSRRSRPSARPSWAPGGLLQRHSAFAVVRPGALKRQDIGRPAGRGDLDSALPERLPLSPLAAAGGAVRAGKGGWRSPRWPWPRCRAESTRKPRLGVPRGGWPGKRDRVRGWCRAGSRLRT
jgi:hypothetical protein